MFQTFAQMMAAMPPTAGPSVCTMALPGGGRFQVMRNSTSLTSVNRTPAATPAAAPKPAAASPQQLAAMRAALRQAVREDLELHAKPAPPTPPAAPPAKGGLASRIRFNGTFNAFKKRAAAPAA